MPGKNRSFCLYVSLFFFVHDKHLNKDTQGKYFSGSALLPSKIQINLKQVKSISWGLNILTCGAWLPPLALQTAQSLTLIFLTRR